MNIKQRVAIITTDNNVERVQDMLGYIHTMLGNAVSPIRDGASQALLVNVHSDEDITRLFNMSLAKFNRGIIYTDVNGIALQIDVDGSETVLGKIKQVSDKTARFTDGQAFFDVEVTQ
jgi:hypothetical protein